MKLEDTVAEKDSDVTFTCKVSDEDMDVTWLIDSQSLPESDKYSVVSEDVTHTLTIRDVQPKDSCDVTAQFGDQSTIAKLSVAGEFTLYLRVVECSCFHKNLVFNSHWYVYSFFYSMTPINLLFQMWKQTLFYLSKTRKPKRRHQWSLIVHSRYPLMMSTGSSMRWNSTPLTLWRS